MTHKSVDEAIQQVQATCRALAYELIPVMQSVTNKIREAFAPKGERAVMISQHREIPVYIQNLFNATPAWLLALHVSLKPVSTSIHDLENKPGIHRSDRIGKADLVLDQHETSVLRYRSVRGDSEIFRVFFTLEEGHVELERVRVAFIEDDDFWMQHSGDGLIPARVTLVGLLRFFPRAEQPPSERPVLVTAANHHIATHWAFQNDVKRTEMEYIHDRVQLLGRQGVTLYIEDSFWPPRDIQRRRLANDIRSLHAAGVIEVKSVRVR